MIYILMLTLLLLAVLTDDAVDDLIDRRLFFAFDDEFGLFKTDIT